jgi:UDP-2,4-diacetamido-2,4,6-trideoxy-beta-L-altropyranose hydrolase
MRIVTITMGGTEVGMGHIFRSITLAKDLVPRAEIFFILNEDEISKNLIKKSGFRAITAGNNDGIKQYVIRLKPNIIIFDKLNVDENLAKEIKTSTGSKLVLFENESGANCYASVVVNAIIHTNFKNTIYTDEHTNTLFLCGPKYWILRPEFYEYKRKGKILNSGIQRIVLAFGGSDPANLSSKVLTELLLWERDLQIDICLGIHFSYFQELNAALTKYSNNSKDIKTFYNPPNIAELMYRADLVITSPGTCAVEALSIGTPIIAITQNADQDEEYKDYLSIISQNNLMNIKDKIVNADFIYPYQKNIAKAEIGEGKEEVLQAILT